MLPAYFVTYKEQYYKLYHIHYQQYPDDTLENIYWLEKAINADFCNPLYALGKINDRTDWEKYRYLFMMHLNLKMVEQHLRLGMKYDKQVAYFYNAPWKEQNIESLKMAEFLFLTDLQYWEDERERIVQKKLNYERTITRELERLAKVRAEFIQMEETY